MPCPTNELINQYHDGELSPEREAFVRDHLSLCEECRRMLADLQRFSVAFASAPVMRLSPAARARIEEALMTPPWVRLVMPYVRPFAAAAMLMLAVGLPMLIGSASTSTAEAATPAVWETAALTGDPATEANSTPQAQFANWVVTDLSTPARR